MVRTLHNGSPNSEPSPPTFSPNPAFLEPNGDTYLRSSDSVLFSVYRCILIQASSIFSRMFEFDFTARSPTSQASAARPPRSKSARNETVLSEPAHVVDALLRFIYPLPGGYPIFDDLSQLTPVLIACIKYEIPVACRLICQQLMSPSFLFHEPLRVYAIACRLGLWEEAQVASRATLRTNLFEAPLCDELRYISAFDYHRLLALHQSRSQAALDLLAARSRSCSLRCSQCSIGGSTGSGRYAMPPKWWYEFERRARIELSRRPLTDVIFSMRFLSECANAGCPQCGASILDSYVFMENLKTEMDALPDTIKF